MMFAANLVKFLNTAIIFLLLLDKALGARTSASVYNMTPVPLVVLGKLLPPLDQQHAGVADLAHSVLLQLEACPELIFILGAVREAGTAGLGLANATSFIGPEHLGFVEGGHPLKQNNMRLS